MDEKFVDEILRVARESADALQRICDALQLGNDSVALTHARKFIEIQTRSEISVSEWNQLRDIQVMPRAIGSQNSPNGAEHTIIKKPFHSFKNLGGVLDILLEISRKDAAIEEQMKAALLSGDDAQALLCARALCGERKEVRVKKKSQSTRKGQI